MPAARAASWYARSESAVSCGGILHLVALQPVDVLQRARHPFGRNGRGEELQPDCDHAGDCPRGPLRNASHDELADIYSDIIEESGSLARREVFVQKLSGFLNTIVMLIDCIRNRLHRLRTIVCGRLLQ